MILKTLGWSLLISWIVASCYWHVCEIKGLCDFPLVGTQAQTPPNSSNVYPPSTLLIADGSLLILQSNGNFHFKKSSPVADYQYVQKDLDSLAKYLRANPGKRLTIIGAYTSEESPSTSFSDLGISRASSVKDVFAAYGFADSIFTLKSELNNHLAFVQDSLTGGITFTFTDVTAFKENDLKASQGYEDIFKPIDLFLPAASVEYIETTQNQLFLIKAKKYLDTHADKKLILTNHTNHQDNTGGNLKTTQKLTLAVKQQLTTAGIAPERIIINEDGARSKVVSDTSRGKNSIRRVTIVVQ